jgi:RHS repeat-associated protein
MVLPRSQGQDYSIRTRDSERATNSPVWVSHGPVCRSSSHRSTPSLDQYHDTYQFDIYWTEGNGAKHKFTKLIPNSYNTNPVSLLMNNQDVSSSESDFMTISTGSYFDGSGTGTATIWFKNGSSLYFEKSLTGQPGGEARWTMTTANGNTQVTTGNAACGLPTSDTFGRTISCASDTVTVTDANGQSQNYHWAYQTITVSEPPETPYGYSYLYYPTMTPSVLASLQLPNGKTYQFTYDSTKGVITKITFPSGGYIRYTWGRSFAGGYEGPWQVTSRAVSSDGTANTEKTWSYSYYYNEWFGQAESGWPPRYQGTIASTVVTDPTGAKVVHYYSNGLETKTEYRKSDSTLLKTVLNVWGNTSNNPRVTSTQTKTDFETANNRVDYSYDDYNNVTGETYYDYDGTKLGYKTRTFNTSTGQRKDLLASEILYKPDDTVAAKAEYSYDEYSLTSRSNVPGHNGNTSNSGRGNLTTIKRYKDANNYTTEHLHYDSVGNVVEKVDPLGYSTVIDYTDDYTDSTDHHTFAYPTVVTNALNQSTHATYNYDTGLPVQTTDLRGYSTTTTYDLMNRVTSITEPNGKQTTYTYDDTNRITTKEVTVDGSGNKGRVKTYFDGLYRVIQTRTNDPEGEFAVDTTYDALGRAAKVSNPYRVSGSPGAWTYAAFDAIGRVVCTSVSTQTFSPCDAAGPTDAKVLYAYSLNKTTTTNEAGNQRRYTYNALGKLVKVEEPNPTLDTPLVTTYTYELTGPLKTTNQSNQTRTLTHDWLGRETQENLPESGITSYTYDDAGHMLTATDARNVVTSYSYDVLGRATQRSYSDSTPTVTFSYDETINSVPYTGLRTSMTDSVGSVTYQYDIMDRLTTETRTFDQTKSGVSGTFTTGYAYNVKGDLTQMTYPSGRVVDFSYAANGGCCNSRLSQVSDATTSTTLATGMSYEPSGALNALTLNPNGSVPITQAFTYNYRLQQTGITAVVSATTAIMSLNYDYGTTNNTGELLWRTDMIQPEHSVSYTYDSIYRLSQVMSADASWGIAWTFDAWSNRLTQTPQGYATGIVGTQSLAYSNNRLTAIANLVYDNAGNLTNEGTGGHTYTYNGKNQITQVDNGGTATYMYDGEGRRVKKTVGSVSTFYFYGPGGIISEFSTTSGATGASSSDRTNYETSDRQGTAVLLVASNGLVLENNRTLPYGELWYQPTASTTTKKFTTYERDQESRLDYAQKRFFANAYGRFVSPDKGPILIIKPTSLNRFLYVMADPVNLVDYDGNCSSADATISPTETGMTVPPEPNPKEASVSNPNETLTGIANAGPGMTWQSIVTLTLEATGQGGSLYEGSPSCGTGDSDLDQWWCAEDPLEGEEPGEQSGTVVSACLGGYFVVGGSVCFGVAPVQPAIAISGNVGVGIGQVGLSANLTVPTGVQPQGVQMTRSGSGVWFGFSFTQNDTRGGRSADVMPTAVSAGVGPGTPGFSNSASFVITISGQRLLRAADWLTNGRIAACVLSPK